MRLTGTRGGAGRTRPQRAPGGSHRWRALGAVWGFTLVEVLVALVVLAVGMLGLALLLVEGLQGSRTAIEHTQAVNLAAETDPAGLIVESTFTSIPDMATRHYPFVPKFVIRTRMDSLAKIGGIRCPLLSIHSRSDEVVPFELGRKLFEAAPEPKTFYEVEGAGHNETWLVGGQGYFEAIAGFVRSVGREVGRSPG